MAVSVLFFLCMIWGLGVVVWALWAPESEENRHHWMPLLLGAWVPALVLAAIWLLARVRTEQRTDLWVRALAGDLGLGDPGPTPPWRLAVEGIEVEVTVTEAEQSRYQRLIQKRELFRYQAVAFSLPYQGDREFRVISSDNASGWEEPDQGFWSLAAISGARPPGDETRKRLGPVLPDLFLTGSDGIPLHENLNLLEVGGGRIRFLGEFGRVWFHPANVRRVARGLAAIREALRG